MSFQALAQPAPTVGTADAEPACESTAVRVAPAKFVEEPRIEAAPEVSRAVARDHERQAPRGDSGQKEKTLTPSVESSAVSRSLSSAASSSGLSLADLRKKGTGFESEAAVIKGGVRKDLLKKVLPFFFDERDFVSYGEVRRYVFLGKEGSCLFVYGDATEPRPLYAIELSSLRAEIEDRDRPDKFSYSISPQAGTNKPGTHFVTVLFKKKTTGKQAYQMTFDTRNDKTMIKRFMDVLRTSAERCGGDVVSATVVDAKMAKAFPK